MLKNYRISWRSRSLSSRTYKVHLTALSSDPAFGESKKSNELLVNTQMENHHKLNKKNNKEKIVALNLNVSSTYDDALEVEWHQPLFSKQ